MRGRGRKRVKERDCQKEGEKTEYGVREGHQPINLDGFNATKMCVFVFALFGFVSSFTHNLLL